MPESKPKFKRVKKETKKKYTQSWKFKLSTCLTFLKIKIRVIDGFERVLLDINSGRFEHLTEAGFFTGWTKFVPDRVAFLQCIVFA